MNNKTTSNVALTGQKLPDNLWGFVEANKEKYKTAKKCSEKTATENLKRIWKGAAGEIGFRNASILFGSFFAVLLGISALGGVLGRVESSTVKTVLFVVAVPVCLLATGSMVYLTRGYSEEAGIGISKEKFYKNQFIDRDEKKGINPTAPESEAISKRANENLRLALGS
ncbi:MAG: hypothetical protein WC521_09425 [Bdellovibrionales bacterium]